jgi:Fe-S cluster assembly scaffold protein SufB
MMSTKTRVPNTTLKETPDGQIVAKRGISREVVDELSRVKGEPDWMRQRRIDSYEIFERKPMPKWGVDLSDLDFDDLVLFSPPGSGKFQSWDDVPDEQKDTFEKLGIPQAEREYLAGVVGVWDNNPFYEGLKEEYAAQGILFCAMEEVRAAAGQQVLRAARRRMVGRLVRVHPQGRPL